MAVLSIPKKAVLPQELVLKMFDLAISKAKELGIKQNIAIVDDGGNLSGFIKMDGANILPAQIAQTKAYAALGFGMPTADWYEAIKDNPAVLQGLLQVDKMTILGGGLPIFLEGQLVGGIGVSGGSPEQDVECAQAALEAIKDL
ncbi:cobalamin adenosyltransferase [Bacillus sp. AFS076308]|uniref:GlcG/HbpS family heme-binding protein n=1 Tax=unclassified Bacillus (in: firmicutes) TaxID=185979 RepID=UPI000BF3CBDD|nr:MULTISPECIES: heme-binding protein [unclassified Bacillus (in: firmicutes)]PFN82740.1 cobalamin adenosyltransferase [Bacillus sp. AFS076308]PGV50237.1 cobalamin adenosyltransferase [Bacillus sp. AFS037270]